jgi:DNA polymerase
MQLPEAQKVTYAWRDEYAPIAEGWKTCHAALTDIANGVERPIDPWELCWTGKDYIKLPSGRKIWYPGLHQETGDNGKSEWWYGEGRNRARIYAGKVDENIVQALARDVMADVIDKLHRRYAYKPALLVHDEIVLVVPEQDASEARARLDAAMREETHWWPDLIKWSESDIATTYGAAK